MAPNFTTTREAAASNGIKTLVYGPAGAGKTRLCATVPDAVIISAEGGLLSLRDVEIPVIEVTSLQDVVDTRNWLEDSKEADQFQWVCLDSISEIAEIVLKNEKEATKDPRQAYGALIDFMTAAVRMYRDLSKNVYMSAKQAQIRDEATGMLLYGPSMPGSKLGQAIPYLFDEVFALRTLVDAEGNAQNVLQTNRDGQYEAKDRSGALDLYEVADLSSVAQKIGGSVD